MSVNDQPVEEWARTHPFSQPLRLAEVEAGVLARAPLAGTGTSWVVGALTGVGWLSMVVAFFLGPGVALVGLLAVWLAGRDAPPGGADVWIDVAGLVFGVGSLAFAFYLVEVVRARRRHAHDVVSAVVTVVASAASFFLLRSLPADAAPGWLSVAVIAMGVIGAAVLVASLLSAPRTSKPQRSQPPARGPLDAADRDRYLETRERVLGIVVDRGLLTSDELEQGRINAMPLGYWEELDGVEEKERRRILEYAVIGWREFTPSDQRVWSPPEQQSKRKV